MKTLFLILSLLLFLQKTYGSSISEERKTYLSEVGKILKCNSEPYNNWLLDFFEAKEQYSFSIDIPRNSNSPFETAKDVFLRLKRIHPVRAEYYITLVDHFLPLSWKELKDISLGGKPADSAVIPKNCTQATALSFHIDESSDDLEIKFLVDHILFQSLGFEQQVALIVHSILAFEGIGYTMVENAVGTRMYTGLLLSKNISMMNQEQFLNFLNHISYYGYLDTRFPTP